MDGAPACPFVAFGDDRESRSPGPDHRHRCFAETPPAPRAAAHQEAYCLSSAFPVCPTFQDWARREAAHARGDGSAAESAPTATATVPDDLDDDPDTAGDADPGLDADDPPVRRNPPRDWAAPPPWASGPSGSAGAPWPTAAGAGVAAASADAARYGGQPVEARGLAGSAADRLANGLPVAAGPEAPEEELAGLAQSRSGSAAKPATPPSSSPPPPSRPPAPSGRRPSVSSTRSTAPVVPGPSWEHLQRYEAYPTIKTRAGLPGIPRIAIVGGALAIAALTLFMLPALLGVGGGGPAASPTPSPAIATPSPSPTIPPEPTPQVYVVAAGDSLGKIANKFGLTVDDLLAANPEIKNPNKISVGQEIIIPVPGATAS